MLRLTGINKYMQKTAAQKARIKNGAANYVRAATRVVLRDLVLNTPQWSGNTAASWRIDLNTLPASEDPSSLYNEDWESVLNFGGEPSFIGDKRAWRVALADNAAAFKAIRYNTKVRIVNVAPFADELATESEANLKLRPGNFIPGDVMALKLVSTKYKLLNNELGLQIKQVLNYE